jgi:hypothetical protein
MNLHMLWVSQQLLQENDMPKRVACELVNGIPDRSARGHLVSLGPQTDRRHDKSGRQPPAS